MRPHIPFRETITARITTIENRFDPIWHSRALDVKANTLVQCFASVRILSDTGDPTDGLHLGGRLVGSWGSDDVAVSTLVTAGTEFGSQTFIRGLGQFTFPTMQARDSLAMNIKFQLLGWTSPEHAGRVLRLMIDGMLVAGQRQRTV